MRSTLTTVLLSVSLQHHYQNFWHNTRPRGKKIKTCESMVYWPINKMLNVYRARSLVTCSFFCIEAILCFCVDVINKTKLFFYLLHGGPEVLRRILTLDNMFNQMLRWETHPWGWPEWYLGPEHPGSLREQSTASPQANVHGNRTPRHRNSAEVNQAVA